MRHYILCGLDYNLKDGVLFISDSISSGTINIKMKESPTVEKIIWDLSQKYMDNLRQLNPNIRGYELKKSELSNQLYSK